MQRANHFGFSTLQNLASGLHRTNPAKKNWWLETVHSIKGELGKLAWVRREQMFITFEYFFFVCGIYDEVNFIQSSILFTRNLMPKYENEWNFTTDSLMHSHDVVHRQTHTHAQTHQSRHCFSCRQWAKASIGFRTGDWLISKGFNGSLGTPFRIFIL
jgi:hypothetical protein